jgi:hypothetical protein
MLRRDLVDEAKQPLPPSLAQWAARAGLGVACAVAALCVFNAVLQWTDSAMLTAGAAIALASAVIVPIRRRPVRALWLAVLGWTATSAILSVVVFAWEASLTAVIVNQLATTVALAKKSAGSGTSSRQVMAMGRSPACST